MKRVTLPSLLLPACIALNDVCPPDISEVIGETATALDIRKSTLRAREAAAGDMLADALLAGTAGAEIAVVPAEFLAQSSRCGDRDYIPRGPSAAPISIH